MQPLLQKLDTVAAETGEGTKQTAGGKSGGDEFQRLKSQIAASIKEIRSNLRKRDDLLQQGATGTKQTVQMSHTIRAGLKSVREDANKLMALQRKEATRSKKAAAVEKAENRQEVVELVFKHIEECELQEKKRYAGKASEIRIDLFSGMGGGIFGGATTSSTMSGAASSSTGARLRPRSAKLSYGALTSRSACSTCASHAGGTELPDIETQEGLLQLQRKNEEIDEQVRITPC